MTGWLIRLSNAPSLILITIVCIAIQTSLFGVWPLNYLQPDVVLVLTVWCALRRDFAEGGILILILANISEIHSGAPMGLYMVSTMATYLMILALSKYIFLTSYNSWIGTTLFATVFFKITSLILLFFLDYGTNQWRHTLSLLPWSAVVNALLAHLTFRWLDRFDWFTHKHPKTRQGIPDESYVELGEEI